MAKQTYVKGSKGTKATPTIIPPKPLPAFKQSIDVTLFKADTRSNRGKQ